MLWHQFLNWGTWRHNNKGILWWWVVFNHKYIQYIFIEWIGNIYWNFPMWQVCRYITYFEPFHDNPVKYELLTRGHISGEEVGIENLGNTPKLQCLVNVLNYSWSISSSKKGASSPFMSGIRHDQLSGAWKHSWEVGRHLRPRSGMNC